MSLNKLQSRIQSVIANHKIEATQAKICKENGELCIEFNIDDFKNKLESELSNYLKEKNESK